MNRCPTCNSKEPHLHPATAFEGEVEVCADDFHLTPTNRNRPEYIAAVRAKQTSPLQSANKDTDK